jgi:DNA-binding transcriptional ArsR family regulator
MQTLPRVGVMIEVPALAMAQARFTQRASPAVLLAILRTDQVRELRDQPVAISVPDFCELTGFSPSSVRHALHELRDRGIVKVNRGHGRGHVSTYRVTDPSRWKGAA